jgi:hypothetical protein
MAVNTQKCVLFPALEEIISLHRCAFRQRRTYLRCLWLVFGAIFAFGRKTLSQILISLGAQDCDWTAFYRLLSHKRFCYETLSSCLLKAALARVVSSGIIAAAVDATHVVRSSKTMPGSSWGKSPRTACFKPGVARMQRFSHLCLLTELEQGYSRAIPIRMLPAPPPKAVECEYPACSEWEAGLAQINWLRSQLNALDDTLRSRRLLVAMDGGYDVNALVAAIPANVTCLIRSARNRKLFQMAPSVRPMRRGRRCVYGEEAPRPCQFAQMRKGWLFEKVKVRGRDFDVRFRVEGPFLVEGAAKSPVFLIVVGGYRRKIGGKLREGDPRYFLVNADWSKGKWQLPMEPKLLLAWAYQRWEIEVCHRELKTSFGMGQMQCWSVRASTMSVQWMAWAYSILMLAGYQAWKGQLGGPIRSTTAWFAGSRRWSFNNLWQGFRLEIWQRDPLKTVCPVTRNKPPINLKKERSLLIPAILSSVRG